ncbi:MAG TPA: DUF1631 family protein [Casimicrobiaceae bacterium]
MLDTPTTTLTFPPATDADGKLLLSAEEANSLLRDCFAEFKLALHDPVAMSIETTNDLFEMNEYVSENDAQEFRSKRGEWVKRFEQTLTDLFEKRIAGKKRSGRRPDFDASLTTLRVLNAFDQEKQASLIMASAMVRQTTRREMNAIDMRAGVLLREPRIRDTDNPFSPDYVLDAIGVTCRSIYPNPRVWRPLMERVLADITPGIKKVYIRVNRLLADRHVLPEIKAELRARSDLRPADDAELLPAFLQLFKEAGPSVADALLAMNIQVPAASAAEALPASVAPEKPAALAPVTPPVSRATDVPSASTGEVELTPAPAIPNAPVAEPAPPMLQDEPPSEDSDTPLHHLLTGAPDPMAHAVPQPVFITANPYVVDVAREHPPAVQPVGAFGLPTLDPMLALGTLSTAVAVLDRWQHLDPGGRYGDADGDAGRPGDAEGPSAALPLNRIPFMRAAIADKIVNSTDKITMDVIALLFDYIFRDPSIPETLRSLFSRLQVPILKTALLDRSFFSNKKHPARRLLDHLAAASIGATGEAGYCASFELIASGIIDEICRDFKVDMGVFEDADVRLQEFVDSEQRKVSASLDTEVVEALSAEKSESDRAHVRVVIRDKLSGLDVPFDVRAFSETVWADYLTEIRSRDGATSVAWKTAVQTLDELLWSITAKERTAQKARLAKLVPSIIRNLRAGATAVKVAAERVQPFLETVYKMHMAAIKPRVQDAPPVAVHSASAPAQANAPSADSAPSTPSTPVTRAAVDSPVLGNVHDFVNEMVVGTWLAFGEDGNTINARLSWVSPLRSKYIFTSRARSKAIVVTPEELAWQLGAGKASLVVEPVPLFDRAVSAALDTLAAARPAAPAPAPA